MTCIIGLCLSFLFIYIFKALCFLFCAIYKALLLCLLRQSPWYLSSIAIASEPEGGFSMEAHQHSALFNESTL